jgi:glycosyltransferase involved in cell wall biosynthesis
MASGLSIVASDLPVHREICRDAALYAPTSSPTGFAEKILALIASRQQREHLAEAGRRRSADFSWANHVDQITRIAKQLVSPKPLPMARAAAVSS